MSLYKIISSITWLGCTFSIVSLNVYGAESTNEKLSDVQQAISQQKQTISQVTKKRAELEAQLKADDLAIAKIAKSIRATAQQQQEVKTQLNDLAQKKTELTVQKQHQEKLLGQQLRAAYSAGHHDYLKLLLNQQNPASIQRTISYYQYLNSARIKEIESFQTTLSSLLKVTTEHQQQAEKLANIEHQQSEQKSSLQASKLTRSNTLKALGTELLTSKQQLEKLEAEEQSLVAALKKLAELANVESEMTGLKKLKKQLSWPVKGKISHRFGTRKQGYLKWKGVLLSAKIGHQVKTIHSGTVLFADWLKGYGLVTVIDHGEGYMSLYGHNQTLLKSVGDRVETGEPIALVGQSGGQQQSGLYFEIRHGGRAVNPTLWCR